MPVIATNLSSLRAQRALRTSQLEVQTAVQRLASGLRVNGARDDAAGIAIATRMTTQLGGLSVGIRNANDALSVAQIADGAFDEMVRNLNRAHSLAVQAASFGASGARATGTAAGGGGSAATWGVSASTVPVVASGVAVAQSVTVAGTTYALGSFAPSATALAAAVNAAGIPGLSATAQPGAGTATGVVATSIGNNDGTAELRLNGVNIALDGVAGDPSGNVARARDAINAVSGATGITATLVSTAEGSRLDLAQGSGGTFTLRYRSLSFASSKLSDFGIGPAGAANNTVYTLGGDGISFDYVAPAGVTTGTLEFTNTGMSPALFDFVQLSAGTAESGGGSSGGGSPLQAEWREILDELGRIVAQTRYNGARLLDGSFVGRFQIGAHVDEALELALPDLSPGGLGTPGSLASQSIASPDDVARALPVLESALDTLNATRATLGAWMNRMEAVVRNLENVRENVAAARSRLVDADYAVETARLTRGRILQEAATAMVAQANQQPATVLALLDRG